MRWKGGVKSSLRTNLADIAVRLWFRLNNNDRRATKLSKKLCPQTCNQAQLGCTSVASIAQLQTLTMFDTQNQGKHLWRFGVYRKRQPCGTGFKMQSRYTVMTSYNLYCFNCYLFIVRSIPSSPFIFKTTYLICNFELIIHLHSHMVIYSNKNNYSSNVKLYWRTRAVGFELSPSWRIYI